jgi:hypothetical protein
LPIFYEFGTHQSTADLAFDLNLKYQPGRHVSGTPSSSPLLTFQRRALLLLWALPASIAITTACACALKHKARYLT